MILEAKFIESNHEMNSAMGIKFVASPFIDDGTVSANSAWSSKNTVDKLGLSFNESGATVVCEPLEGSPIGVVSHIVPKQSGSGDPSPSNIRPITGYDSIKLSRTGKNLFGGEALADALVLVGGTKDASNGTVSFFGGNHTPRLFTDCKKGKQYTAIAYGSNSYGGGHTNLYFKYTDGSYDVLQFSSKTANEKSYAVFTSRIGKDVDWFSTVSAAGTTTLEYDKCGLFEGVVSLEEFEPYNGGTFTIDLGQTVYGGTYNWKTGELTISYASIVYDGTTSGKMVTMTDAGAKTYAYQAPTPKPKIGGKVYGDRTICNSINGLVVTVSKMSKDITGVTDSDSDATVISKINATLKSWYDAGTPLTCVYEIETPTTIQLTPQEILALSGTNYISSSTGDTEVNGKQVTDSVIQDIYNKLNALSATLTALTGV